MANNFEIQLKVNNIGPHFGAHSLEFNDKVDSNKAAFFAMNGTGKTFISRAIRLSESIPQQFDATRVLSLNTTEGELSFSVISGGEAKTLNVSVEEGCEPVISNSLGLIFHVFNSDFVEENVKAKSFSPDGDIEGYILGKIQIDLSDERATEAALEEEIKGINEDIDNTITVARKELRDSGVQASTTEMRLISKDKIKEGVTIDATDTFEQIVEKLNKLKDVPEDLADLSLHPFSPADDILNDAVDLLITEYPQSSWDEEFVSSFQEKRSFIEQGLEYSSDDTICPFCGRTYDDDSLEMIRQYRAYLADKQAQIQKSISDSRNAIQSTLHQMDLFIAKCKASAGELSEIARYFPSLKEEKILVPEIGATFISMLSEIDTLLNKKEDSLSCVIEVNPQWKECWISQENAFANASKKNAEVIRRVNRVKNDTNGERLSLRRELCKAKYVELYNTCTGSLKEIESKKKELIRLQDSIRYKEQQAKVSRKDKVLDTLTYLLNQFFYDKYTLDPDSFEIQFRGKNLGKNVGNYLSDGEKGIVAFCLYLAYVHQLIETEEDYDKLFFVIDDPISSMDFNYVYGVAQTIREIKSIFNIQNHERIWVFTHNLEFLSIIARNHVLPNVYLITPGNIERYDSRLLMPYESHLHDIVCIANGIKDPSHTTGNSIRHIIETIARFEDPYIGLEKYIEKNEVLCDNSAIYALCQDLSHGNVRSELPYTPEIMKNACKTVKLFVESKYPEQVANVKS